MLFPASVDRVAQYLQQAGHSHAPVLLDNAARTAQQAADGLKVQLGQIAKSIIFKRKPDETAVLVVTSGDRRVNEKKVQALVCSEGQKLGRADAEFVREATGYAIGGVPPVAHAKHSVVLIDAHLARFEVIWAAAGHPHAVFQLSVRELCALTRAQLCDVT